MTEDKMKIRVVTHLFFKWKKRARGAQDGPPQDRKIFTFPMWSQQIYRWNNSSFCFKNGLILSETDLKTG